MCIALLKKNTSVSEDFRTGFNSTSGTWKIAFKNKEYLRNSEIHVTGTMLALFYRSKVKHTNRNRYDTEYRTIRRTREGAQCEILVVVDRKSS